MYPNLYYVFKDWFGVEWSSLKILNTFGLMVALAFVAAAWVITSELKRKEKAGLLLPREETIVVGRPASLVELITNGLVGFIFGYKLFGLLLDKLPEVNPQEYIFSKEGNILGGIFLAAVLVALKWYERYKKKLKTPQKRSLRIWPHDRVGDIVILALVFGILGSKLFDAVEHWDSFVADPIGTILSPAGLTFYGGLIMAAIVIIWYAYRKGINLKHLVDAAAPSLMIAYAIGRIGCQVAGDGDWGVFNNAYVSDSYGKVSVAGPGEYDQKLAQYSDYFTKGEVKDSTGLDRTVTDRIYNTLDKVPSQHWKGPSFLPNWFFAYSFPQNVNDDGIVIPGNNDDHNRVLPQPVIPTSLYETIICGLMFLFMWGIRRKIKIPLMMFAIYLVLNGGERFFIEMFRVNKVYATGGYYLSQAEIIAVGLMFAGVVLGVVAFLTNKKQVVTEN